METPIILQRPSISFFAGLTDNFEVTDTTDGNWTLKSQKYNETSHSTHGAYTETLHCYFNPTNIIELISQDKPFHILEIGFGCSIAYEFFRYFLFCNEKIRKTPKIYYTGIEIDGGLKVFRDQNVHNLLVPNDYGNFLNLNVIYEDAITGIEKVQNNSIDIIFQDAFCLKSTPQLWTKDWFSVLHSKANLNARLGTFSASTSVKMALESAQWSCNYGEPFHRKKGALNAQKLF